MVCAPLGFSQTFRSRMPGRTFGGRSACRRNGATAFEFAVVAPVIFLIVLALIQFSLLLMNQNVLTAAAREGARLACLESTVSRDLVISEVQQRLGNTGLDPNNVSIEISPEGLHSLKAGDEVRVSLSVPMSTLVFMPIPETLSLTAEAAYQRE